MHRRKGRIARLPKTVRDTLNQFILDGVSYPNIIRQLGDHGKGLNQQNLCNWKHGGHKDWLKQLDRLENMRAAREFALDVLRDHQDTTISEATLQLAASQIYEVITEFDPKTLKKQLRGDPENYARLVNTLFRLTDSGLKYERYRAEVAQRKANIEKELALSEPGGITPETRRRIEQELKLM